MSNLRSALFGAAVCLLASFGAQAQTPTTTTSPTGGPLPSGVTAVGGIVADLLGLNGTRIVTQLSAASLFQGFASTDPLTIGTQTGFSPAVIAALGGGIASASFRVTLDDGDTSPGDFDFNELAFLVNSLNFGNFSAVQGQETNGTGTVLFSTGLGFTNGQLDTGFFSSVNAALLASLFTSLTATGSLTFALDDVDPGDNFFDFTRGVAGGLINVGTGPIVTPPPTGVPEPASLALFGAGLLGLATTRRRRMV